MVISLTALWIISLLGDGGEGVGHEGVLLQVESIHGDNLTI